MYQPLYRQLHAKLCDYICVIRIYEHVSDVGLFLFNDALVLTRRRVHHTPFTLTYQSTHTFLASVALSSLSVREVTHTRCEFLFYHINNTNDATVFDLVDGMLMSL